MERLYQDAERDKLLALLRQVRIEAGLTQWELANRIGRPQSLIAKYEGGERRLDILELRVICRELGITLPAFISRLEDVLKPKA